MTRGEALKKVRDWLNANREDPPLTDDMMAAIKRVLQEAEGKRA